MFTCIHFVYIQLRKNKKKNTHTTQLKWKHFSFKIKPRLRLSYFIIDVPSTSLFFGNSIQIEPQIPPFAQSVIKLCNERVIVFLYIIIIQWENSHFQLSVSLFSHINEYKHRHTAIYILLLPINSSTYFISFSFMLLSKPVYIPH